MHKKTKAFTLIEFSLVLFIIGIAIIGTIKATELFQASKVATARSLTKSSPVSSISGLTLWVETSGAFNENLLTTFNGSIIAEEGDPIKSWKGINTQIKPKEIIQTTENRCPKYTQNGINNIPSLTFDTITNEQDYLHIINNVPIKKGDDSYSMFVVWKGIASGYSGNWWPIISQGQDGLAENAGIGIDKDGKFHYYSNFDADSDPNTDPDTNAFSPAAVAYTQGAGFIVAATVDNNEDSNIRLYVNGTMNQGATAEKDDASIFGQNFTVGADPTLSVFTGGLISEIIIYKKKLTHAQVAEINDYLSQKYAIALN